MNIRFKNETIPLQIEKIDNEHYEIQIYKEKHTITIKDLYIHIPSVFYCIFEWNQSLYKAIITKDKKKLFITIDGYTYNIEIEKEEITAPAHIELEISEIRSPLPGTISKIYIKEGQEVQKDDILVIIESMKMENQIISPKKAKIEKIYIKEKQKVETNQLLIKLI